MKFYRKKLLQPMRPYILDEDMRTISIAQGDTPEVGGVIAVNPNDETDKWYIAKDFFNNNYEEIEL